ncbi:hypothetical protein P9X10_02535 [Bacillus cereus]|nr:hypothetical protein [Bacillus cereus]
MVVRKAGRRKMANNGDVPPSSSCLTYSYVSPKVSLECEKLSEEELKDMSSEVKTYSIEELSKRKEGN